MDQRVIFGANVCELVPVVAVPANEAVTGCVPFVNSTREVMVTVPFEVTRPVPTSTLPFLSVSSPPLTAPTPAETVTTNFGGVVLTAPPMVTSLGTELAPYTVKLAVEG